MKTTTTVADLRMAQALGIKPDLSDRDSIARARHAVAVEAAANRSIIEAQARVAQLDGLDQLKNATFRLEKLLARMSVLDAMAKAALQAQVEADPEMTGATVQDDGRIVAGNLDQIPPRP